MARYAYAPLSVEDGDSKRRAGGYSSSEVNNNEYSNNNDDSLLNERMPMCVGLCVLLAIVYVLTSSHQGGIAGSSGTCLTLGDLRKEALSKTPAYILECPEDEPNCHVDQEKRENAIGQKGATIWMTGCSGAGKTTIAKAVEQVLLEQGKHVYRLDGDNLRTGLNRDLTFDASDRAESVRRAGEVATLMSSAGVITLVGLISPYQEDRDLVRQRHLDLKIPFYEVFLDVPLEELKQRDPKGVYKRAAAGEILQLTCVDDPYQRPPNPELVLPTHTQSIEASANQILSALQSDGILQGPKVLTPPLPNPDGDEIIDLLVPSHLQDSKRKEAESLPKVLLSNIDLNWLQVIAEGWVSPLRGFMREGVLLETLHFNSILADTLNVTGNIQKLTSPTNFNDFPELPPPDRISMSLPITLSITSFTKQIVGDAKAVALVTQLGKTVAILRNPEIYANRKEEIVTRMYGVIDPGHPYIQHIYKGGDYLIGGEIELLDKIQYNDGLDQYRLTAKELLQEFQKRGADTVYAFQTRNPTHAGHAYLMKRAGEKLKTEGGYKKPILWLSPLGGWTKEDDVPLDVRVHQHERVLEAGLSHPGGLDPETTVMAIWPAPMVYAGPTEVQFHAKSRRSAGASYFVVGRDPAGMKGSNLAEAHRNDDLYDGNHGRYVLQNAPGIAGHMKLLSFVKVMYDTRDNDMKIPDESRLQDFISISGTKMRLLAGNGATPCDATKPMPTDLIAANCIPPGFMVPSGWNGVVDYYKHKNNPQWIPWSQPRVLEPPVDTSSSKHTGDFGTTSFILTPTKVDSLWHDIPLYASSTGSDNIINLVTEIPMYVTAKMELQKASSQNVIMQDKNSDGSARYYTYGSTFFNYGFVPQTWEDPSVRSSLGHAGDNDPLDVMEIGSVPLTMGSVTPCKVLGSLELIDDGETDHKIICIATSDPMASTMTTIPSDVLTKLQDWLKRYKTSDGKPENSLASDQPTTPEQAMQIISHTNDRWKLLCNSTTANTYNFYLSSPGCRDTLN